MFRCLSLLFLKTWRQSERRIGSVVPVATYPLTEVVNEPILSYQKNSPERAELQKVLASMLQTEIEIPIVIGDDEIRSCDIRMHCMPHDHCKMVAKFSYADEKLLRHAADVAISSQRKWDTTTFPERYAIWEKAAQLMAGPYRQKLNAATMLGQSKTVIQAEIDSAAELIDFIRIHMFYAQEQSRYKPMSPHPNVTLNSMRYRGIDGFVAAISPFNFTAIAGNLAYTPALMGNAVLWKPSDSAILSNWIIFNIMREAGLPAGVVNFVPSDGQTFGDFVTSHCALAGINFTGSVPTFTRLWQQVGENITKYRNFPRISGECGGKNFHFVHPTADFCSVVTGTIRSAFEYSGQKCSACSRMYVPESMWPEIKLELVRHTSELKMGDVQDFTTFMGAVIDQRAFIRISKVIQRACCTDGIEVLTGGSCDSSKGFFIEPTIVQVQDPLDEIMTDEIFGPVLAVYVYKDSNILQAMDLVENSTSFALTGSIFAQDEEFCRYALERFKMVAGNIYINDKSTGAVVGQQPFGGARHSGTNDKAGGPSYAIRWTSPQSIKETFEPLKDIIYPYMQ